MSMNIQIGHIARHTPRGAGAQGREAAVVDVAQDLLLAHMHEAGILGNLAIKLDFSPQPWLAPAAKGWAPMPIHAQYGFALPEVPTVRLEENIAEKVARLNRTTTARDMYDLRWIMTNPALAPMIDKALVRRLAVLKIWVDTNGMHAGDAFWKPGHQGSVFDPAHWLRERNESEFDPEDIGALAVPRPSAKEMSDAVRERFAFLADLDADELEIAQSDPRSRSVVIKAMSNLPDKTFNAETLF